MDSCVSSESHESSEVPNSQEYYDSEGSQDSLNSQDFSANEISVTSTLTLKGCSKRRHLDIPYCTCAKKNKGKGSQVSDYQRMKTKRTMPRTKVMKMKMKTRKDKKPTYYCICNTPNRPCICNKKPKGPPPQKMKREVLRNGQKYTYLPNWLVGRLIDIFKEQERRKSKKAMSDPEILALGVKKGDRKKKSMSIPKNKNKRESAEHQQQQQAQQQQQQAQQQGKQSQNSAVENNTS